MKPYTVVGYIDYSSRKEGLVILGCFEGHHDFIGTQHKALAPYVHCTVAASIPDAHSEARYAYEAWASGTVVGTSTVLAVSVPSRRLPATLDQGPTPVRGWRGTMRRVFGR